MQAVNDEGELRVTAHEDGARLIVEGELSIANADAFTALMSRIDRPAGGQLTLDLGAFDILDGAGVATAVNAVRALCSRLSRLTLRAAPQMLAHNLYRVGMLESRRLELVDTRQEEPYS